MKMPVALMILVLAAPLAAASPVPAVGPAASPAVIPGGQRDDQMRAFDGRRTGKLMPLREIERRVVPTMPGAQYLGFEFDGGSSVYTLKFLRDGRVIWVDVDGRSGQVIGRTGK